MGTGSCTSNATVRIAAIDYLVTAGHCFVDKETVKEPPHVWLTNNTPVSHDGVLIGYFDQSKSFVSWFTSGADKGLPYGNDFALVRLIDTAPATEYFHVSNGYYQLEPLVGAPANGNQIPAVLCLEGASGSAFRTPGMPTTCGTYDGF
jgi:hypothetical protein